MCVLLKLLSGDVSFDDTEIVPLFSALGFLSFEFLFRQFDSIILNALYKNRNTSPFIIDTHNNFWKMNSVKIQLDGKSAFHTVCNVFRVQILSLTIYRMAKGTISSL